MATVYKPSFTYKLLLTPPMIDIELFPRYMAHQLRTQINTTIVGKAVDINKKKSSVFLETDLEGMHKLT